MPACQAKRHIYQGAVMTLLSVCLMMLSSPSLGMSLEDEIALGEREHRKIIASLGAYKNPVLQAYISRVGQRVAAESSRREIDYTFTILNDDMINAFALPGGFIYITRGMLMHMNSEAELAAVLGHEIAHVTEKHALRKKSRGKGLDFVNSIIAAVSGQPGIYELGDIFGGVLLSGYSRKFELEADAVGAGYMAKAGYSPLAMLSTIEILKSKDKIEIKTARLENRAPRVYHGFLATHPDNDTRYQEAIRASNKFVRDYDAFIKRDEFLQQLNGLDYGPSRQVGVMRGSHFYHPKLGIKINFPNEWRQVAYSQGLQLISRLDDASMTLTTGKLKRGVTPEDYARDRLGFRLREGTEITIANLPAYLGIAERADSRYGPRPTRFAVIFNPRRRTAYIIQGAGKHDLSRIAADSLYIASIFSFDIMARGDFQIARRPKVQIVRAEPGTSMEQLAKESPITTYALDRLRAMNGLYPKGQPEAGQLIKIID